MDIPIKVKNMITNKILRLSWDRLYTTDTKIRNQNKYKIVNEEYVSVYQALISKDDLEDKVDKFLLIFGIEKENISGTLYNKLKTTKIFDEFIDLISEIINIVNSEKHYLLSGEEKILKSFDLFNYKYCIGYDYDGNISLMIVRTRKSRNTCLKENETCSGCLSCTSIRNAEDKKNFNEWMNNKNQYFDALIKFSKYKMEES